MSDPVIEGTSALQTLPAREPMPLSALSSDPTQRLLEMAIQSGASMDMLERLMALQERKEKEDARKAFAAAMAAFKSNPPRLTKNCLVDFTSQKGRTHYRHADLEEVATPIAQAMAPHGLSFRWSTKQQNNRIFVTTILEHCMGHREELTLEGSPDESGNKNNIQAVGSTITYLERYGLLAITGMAVKGQDNDGAGATSIPRAITEACEQIAKAESIQALQKIYTEAYKKAGNSKAAQAELITAKDQRKAELSAKEEKK
ncbi:MAG TPA: ERF family protein [Geothrix sp.]|nr:ERF family protein [Geothrix sp.]